MNYTNTILNTSLHSIRVTNIRSVEKGDHMNKITKEKFRASVS